MALDYAKALLQNGELDAAREHLLLLVNEDESNLNAWKLLSGIASRSQDHDLSLQAFRAWCHLDPVNALASSGYVQNLVHARRYSDALREIERFRLVGDPKRTPDCEVLEEHEAIRKSLGDHES